MKLLITLLLTLFSLSYAFDKDVVGKHFKDFTCIDENGNTVKASQIINGRPAVVVFFAIGDQTGTYQYLPSLNQLYRKYEDKVEFLAVLLSRSDQQEVEKLKKLLPLEIPVCRAYRDAFLNYRILKVDVPLILVIDRKGTVKHIIARPEATVVEIIPPEKKYRIANRIKDRIRRINWILEEYIEEIGEN
ncbi:MAG: redoxin domain-containing protein [Aquificae bacterium]|nr:redoxin domain-containing protein [Aquificota bacterium]